MTRLIATARRTDPETSHEAAERITAKLSQLQARVLIAVADFGEHGATAREVETLDAFADCGFSTCRKRLSELARAGRLGTNGKRDGMTVYVALACEVAA
jgi:signal transduction histidine kinase